MIITGYVAFGQSLIGSQENTHKNSIYFPLGNNGWVSLQGLDIENSRILSSVIIANILPDLSIDKNNSVLPGSELFSINDVQKRLESFDMPPIELSICFNSSESKISITRGIFGTIPLFYIYRPNTFFCFSNSLKSLTQFDFIRPLLNKEEFSIVNFLSVKNLSESYTSETFYKPISKALPGHELTVSASKIISAPYTSFNIAQWNQLQSKEDYGEVFRDLFKKSLQFAISDDRIIGAHLSGGLDSSSISTLTKYLFPNRVLHTFYGETNTIDTDEGHYALDVVKKINSIHHIVDAPYDEIDKAVLHTSIYASPLNLIHSPARQNGLLQAIRNEGCKIILSGEGGDGIAGYGMEYISELINQRKWPDVKSEFAQMASLIQQAVYHPNWLNLSAQKRQNLYAREHLYKVLVRQFKYASLPQFVAIVYEICKEFGISPVYLFSRGARSFIDGRLKKKSILTPRALLLEKQFNQESIFNLSQTLYKGIPQEIQNAYGSIYNSSSIAVREDTYALSSHYGLITRFPFYNKALLEISMATPAVFKYDNGMRRGHLREAMKGLLPENVRLRFGKAAFDKFAMQSTLRLYEQSQDFLTSTSPVWDYVDIKKFNQLVTQLKVENETPSVYTYTFLHVNRVIFLSIWLDWYKNNIR